MLDTLQVIFWSITYILIIISGVQSSKTPRISMPYIAGVLNFSWEICALHRSRGLWGHVIWLALDLAIVYFGFRYASTKKNRIIYAISILLSTILLLYIFTLQKGMLYSVFVIDLIMAICYLVDRKKLSPKLKISIAVTKLIGDTFAGLNSAPSSEFIAILACCVFACNICYLYLCIKEKSVQNTR